MLSFLKKRKSAESPVQQKVGQEGEERAEKYLVKKGFKIIERNYRCRGGEVDLIALSDDDLHFVEVKTRRSKGFGSSLEAVSFRKRQRLAYAAQDFIMRHGEWEKKGKLFSVVGIDGDEIEFIPNAFEIEGDYY